MDWTNVPPPGLRALLASLGLSLALAAQPVSAAPTELADIPLANASTAPILPNIMLDLDNSGSMAWSYMPDYVRYTSLGNFGTMCRGPNKNNTLVVCEPGDPPFFASAFNGLYYNPAIRYMWPTKADGTRLADHKGNTSYAASWTAVPSDGYGVQLIDDTSAEQPDTTPCKGVVSGGNCPRLSNTAVTNLVTGYPERMWCSHTYDVPPSANCKQAVENGSYSYPDNTYKYLYAKDGAPFYYNVSVEWCKTADSAPNQNFGKAGSCQAKKTDTYKYVRYSNWSRVDITPSTKFPAKAAGRTDCAGNICTYQEEMANFATWYAWYRTRTQMTKSAIGQAFKDVRGTPVATDPDDSAYLHARIGLTTINNPIALDIANFDAAQKEKFYTDLYSFDPLGGTPLRNSLDSLGKMYKGTSTRYKDPVQYSCQKNFTILATDGYWNDSYNGVADTDGAAGVTLPSRDALQTPNTLADVAYYYYHNDLRTSCSSSDVCTNNVAPSGANADVDDVAQHQHMTTFTIGLGVDGTLTYDPNYKTSNSGDYFNIKQGVTKWPAPSGNAPETIDDLWHAAVNGRGTYFSTKDPAALEGGLRKALRSIDSVTGNGAAAATSALQPTAGDNFIYVATYRTVKWDGDVSGYSLDLSTGAVSKDPFWQAEPLLRNKIAATGDSDTRVIYTADGTTRTLFSTGKGGLTAAQLALFDTNRLSQASTWSSTQKTAATAASLVNYLRGQDRNEDQERVLTYGAYERLYRDREKALGDIVHAQPIYVKAPPFNFDDDGYQEFKAAKADRLPTLYTSANDGMLHAFDGESGQERWAYVPPMVLPNMWRLADANYGSQHRYYLDGPLAMSDAKINGSWKTVLIGAMGKGGRGYFALDVTDPTDPRPLWNYTADDNPKMGYSFGTAFITKMADGRWVAVLPSGYNNVPEGTKYAGGDGGGYVFVLDLASGSLLKTIATGVGSNVNPSGLGRINVRSPDFTTNNTAVGAYGGDLTGAMWRFDLEKGTASKLADFPGKPIMVAPVIGQIQDKLAIFYGTGRYLGQSDLDDVDTQTIYGIKDDGVTTVNAGSPLVAQTVTTSGTARNISRDAVEWSSKMGWYVDLPDTGERITLSPQLFLGTLIFASTVPSVSACQPGGYSWLYQLDYKTGGNVQVNVAGGLKYASPIVGNSVVKLPNGTPMIYPVGASNGMGVPQVLRVGPGDPSDAKIRVLWREISD
ncbi:pilus assembly protein [Pseudoduganella sp. R-32]|uniref:pilus assembly protein n=1 Tax=unclassified Pseudoduganella TaxID=2637179 RepID=UPI003CE6ADC7